MWCWVRDPREAALEKGACFLQYVANRFLTAFQNALTGAKLSEYHTGYRAFSRNVLQVLPYSKTPTILF